jgi:hypothetical protein
MMVLIFLTMLAALALAWLHRPIASRLAAAACLVVATWLFLWEIYSPETGFRMPWIDTQLVLPTDGAMA